MAITVDSQGAAPFSVRGKRAITAHHRMIACRTISMPTVRVVISPCRLNLRAGAADSTLFLGDGSVWTFVTPVPKQLLDEAFTMAGRGRGRAVRVAQELSSPGPGSFRPPTNLHRAMSTYSK